MREKLMIPNFVKFELLLFRARLEHSLMTNKGRSTTVLRVRPTTPLPLNTRRLRDIFYMSWMFIKCNENVVCYNVFLL